VTPAPAVLEAFEVLYEAEELPRYLLPFDLERIYGGIGFAEEAVYSNFVTSIDGVAALGGGNSAGSVISGHDPSDRFLMGLLRACSDAVLIGAGTLRATPGHLWTPAHVSPQFADSFAALRRSLGREPEPRLVVMTAHGALDVAHPALQHGATVVTTTKGAQALAGRLPESCEVLVAGKGESVDVKRALDEMRDRGFGVVLTEGGPTVMGHLLEMRAVDEAFITISPVLAGRDQARRLGMVEGLELLPSRGLWASLLSARRHGDYVFLRYRLSAA
jgi:riboflavin biosynthesis pyrimidine reductase